MRRTLFISSIIFTFLGIVAICTSCKKGPSQSPSEQMVSNKYPQILIDRNFTDSTVQNYDILSASINKDILNIVVKFGGGCKKHLFELKTNGEAQTSLYHVHLLHLTNDDRCRRLVVDTLNYDLSPLKKLTPNYSIKINNNQQILPSN